MAWSRARKTIVDGIPFPSKEEAKDYISLKYRQIAGEISDLRLQPKFKLEVNGKHIGYYTADFIYRERGERRETIHERKGRVSRDFPLRWKLCQALYPQYKYLLLK